MNAFKKVALLCALSLFSCAARAQYAVSGSVKVWQTPTSSTQVPLPSGQWWFGASSITITNGTFSGYESGTATVVIKDANGNTLLTVPTVTISGPFVWDTYVVSATAVISGRGTPTIACATGATYLQTDSSFANAAWTCNSGTWSRSNPISPAGSGNYAGTGAPTFTCTSPCSYTQSDAGTPTNAFWTLVAAAGTQSSNWQLQGGSSSGVASFNSRTGAVTPQNSDYSSFYDELGAAAARAGTGACPSNEYEMSDATGGPGCGQVGYGQLASVPSTFNATPGTVTTISTSTYSTSSSDCNSIGNTLVFSYAGNVAVTLTSSAATAGCRIYLKNLTAAGNTITLTPSSGLIDSGSSLTIYDPGDGLVEFDGTNWKAFGGYGVRGAANLATANGFPYVSSPGTVTELPANSTGTRKFLTSVSGGTPSLGVLQSGDVTSGLGYTPGQAQIQQIVVSGSSTASVTFTSIPQTFTSLLIVGNGAVSDTANSEYIYCQLNGDTTTGDYAGYDILYGFTSGTAALLVSSSGINVAALAAASAPANSTGAFYIQIDSYTNTSFFKSLTGRSSFPNGATFGQNVVQLSTAAWKGTSGTPTAVTSITLSDTAGGHFLPGTTFTLYGLL